jgi:hypothetical protein
MRYWEIVQAGAKLVEPKLLAPSLRRPSDTKLPARPFGDAERGYLKKASGPKSSR